MNLVFDDEPRSTTTLTNGGGDSGVSTAEGSYNSSNTEVIHLLSTGTNTFLENQAEKWTSTADMSVLIPLEDLIPLQGMASLDTIIDVGEDEEEKDEKSTNFHIPHLNSIDSDQTGTPDEMLRDLHVYLIPPEAWQSGRSLAQIDVVNNSVSMGFIRVFEELSLQDLRAEISSQLEDDIFNRDYVFVKGVGRHFTEVRAKQEQELRVRNFLPPEAHEPEIFMLEKNHIDNNDPRLSSSIIGTTKDSLSSTTIPDIVSGDPYAERMNLQETLIRLKTQRKQEENKRDALLNKAKELRSRAESHKEKLAVLWLDKYNEEKLKTDPLEEVCDALRKELDAENKKRMDTFDLKMKPIIIRDGPSRKANYKIAAAKLHYEIYELTVRLRHASLRAEQEGQIRELCEAEVKRLREEISEKKLAITTVTKGIPFSRIEVRPEVQLPQVTDPYLLLQSYHQIPTFSMTSSSKKHQNLLSSSKNSFKALPSTSSSGSKYISTSSNVQHSSKKVVEAENS